MSDSSIIKEIRQHLFEMQDIKYRDFNSKLIPNISLEQQIGIRIPALRGYARELLRRPQQELEPFLADLPHKYHEENHLHGFLLEGIRDYGECVERLNAFLPFIDNWGVCDTVAPKALGKHRQELLTEIKKWLRSEHPYTVRYGMGMLMRHFLDEDFSPEYLELVACASSEEYYVNMMAAWYFATALAKQWDAAIVFLKEGRLDAWVHNKAIQKAVESRRISEERKGHLRGLRKGH